MNPPGDKPEAVGLLCRKTHDLPTRRAVRSAFLVLEAETREHIHELQARQNELEMRNDELQLQHSRTLESLGILAGGIGHDLNNLMCGILAYVQMAYNESRDSRVTLYLSKSIGAVHRACGLAKRLLTFAHGDAPVRKVGRLFPFVQQAAQFALNGSSVSCRFEFPEDLWTCDYDESQIGQVIDNLVTNARQAMPTGGTVEVTARNVVVGEEEHPELEKGTYVEITVKDSGPGIPKELQLRIFNPYFTTKQTGHGLGLATCYLIVKRHGGSIDLQTEPGRGCAFRVCLPAAAGSVPSATEDVSWRWTGNDAIAALTRPDQCPAEAGIVHSHAAMENL